MLIRLSTVLLLIGLLPLSQAGAPAAQPPLAEGPYAELRMLYTRTIFRVRVLELSLQVDPPAQARIRDIAADRSYSSERASMIAGVVLDADRVLARTVFLRNIGHRRFVDELISGARCARDAGLIDDQDFERVRVNAASWYAPVRERGIRSGDRAIYRMDGPSMRSTLEAADGTVLVDQIDTGPGPRRTLLGGYLAPCSDFREPLIQSLFR
jgi:hypothetical protein